MAVKWAFEHPRLALEATLVAALVVGGWLYNRKVAQLHDASLQAGKLEDGFRQQIKLKDGQLEILRMENGKLSSHTQYVPPEGSIVIKERDLKDLHAKYQALLAKLRDAMTPEEREKLQKEIDHLLSLLSAGDGVVIVDVKTEGFLWPPRWGAGLEWGNRGIQPRIDTKWAFWDRYSVILGGSKMGVDIGGSRHLDDVLWGRPQNLEVFGGYKFIRLNGGESWAAGLRMGF